MRPRKLCKGRIAVAIAAASVIINAVFAAAASEEWTGTKQQSNAEGGSLQETDYTEGSETDDTSGAENNETDSIDNTESGSLQKADGTEGGETEDINREENSETDSTANIESGSFQEGDGTKDSETEDINRGENSETDSMANAESGNLQETDGAEKRETEMPNGMGNVGLGKIEESEDGGNWEYGQTEEAEGKELRILEDADETAKVYVFLPEDAVFEEDTVLRLLSIEDMTAESEEKEQHCHEVETLLKNAWKDRLAEKYLAWHPEELSGDLSELQDENMPAEQAGAQMNSLREEVLESVRAFFSYYLMLTDREGNEVTLPAKAQIRLVICDETFYEDAGSGTDVYYAAYQGKGSDFQEMAIKEIIHDEEEKRFAVEFEAQETGWFSVVQVDSRWRYAKPGGEDDSQKWDEASDEKDNLPGIDGNGLPDIDETPEMEDSLPGLDGEGETSGTEEELQTETENLFMTYAGSRAAMISSGTCVTASGSEFTLMSPSSLDGSYRSVRWYPGISSLTTFNDAGAGVLVLSDAMPGVPVFYPRNDSAKGKFGVVYHKVMYEDGEWYDLKMTVANYTNQVYVTDAGNAAVINAYPPIGFYTSAIAWAIKPTLGEVIIKMQLFRSGDSGQTPVRKNIRFQWWDIDNAQRFGIRTENGSIKAKYYQTQDSTVYYANQKADSDNAHNYLFLTCCENLGSTDTRGNIGFTLENCSTYYIAIGYKDHAKDNPESRISRESAEFMINTLAAGSINGITLGLLSQSDIDVPIPPDKSYPKKYVSNDAKTWAESNTLAKVTSEYYYRIRQYVPWQTENNYYSKFLITDTLPAGADYVGSIKVLRVEDNKDVTSQFASSIEKDVVKVAPTSAFYKNSGLYGYTFDITFKVRMDPGEIQASYSGNTAVYSIKNTAKAEVAFQSMEETFTQKSNTVTTKAQTERKLPKTPVKGIDKNENIKTKQLASKTDTILFSIFQTIPANDAAWMPSQVTLTDILEDGLQYENAEVYKKENNGFAKEEGWSVGNTGQTVTISKKFSPAAAVYRFDITCRVKDGYDLSGYEQTEGNRRWSVIPNTAKVRLVWAHGEPAASEKSTNEVTVKIPAGAVQARLQLSKEIDGADIVWAHGNPVFTFKITGEDILGVHHTYYRMVEFTPANTGNAAKPILVTKLAVPAGWYTVSEEKTMRYRLNSIYGVSQGIVSGETAVFDVSQGQTGTAVFYNIKTTDEGETHSALAENVMKE